MHFITNLIPVMGVQNLWKSVKICFARVIDKSLLPRFYAPQCICRRTSIWAQILLSRDVKLCQDIL